MKNNNVELTREDLKIVPESPTMELSKTPAVEPSDQTQAAKLVPLVYRVDEIAQLLAISNRAAYNLCNTTKDFKVIRLGTSICRIVLGGDFSDFVTRWHPMGR